MASQTSAIYHGWSSHCFAVMALAEGVLAVAVPNPIDIETLVSKTRALLTATEDVGERVTIDELRRIARHGLSAAARLSEVIEKTAISQDHQLRKLYEEFSDHAELLALSVDPETAAEVERARAESARGEAISLEEIG
jgi:hypothetical protein